MAHDVHFRPLDMIIAEFGLVCAATGNDNVSGVQAVSTAAQQNADEAKTSELDVEVSPWSDSNFYVGLSGDVARGGIFVATWRKVAVGAEVVVRLALPTATVTVRGRVRWLRDLAPGAAPGLGVAFAQLDETDRRHVEAFTERRAPLYVDVDE